MCSSADSFDIALATFNVDIADQVYDEAKKVQDGEAELFKTMGSPDFNIKKWIAENK